MSHHEDCASPSCRLSDLVDEKGGPALVEARVRLVQEQDLRVVDEGARQRQPLLHPARKVATQDLGVHLQADQFQLLVG